MTRTQSIRQAIWQILIDHKRRGLTPPSLRALMQATRTRSTNTIRYHLKALQEEGFLQMDGCKTRTLQILKGSGIPLLGSIAAGTPMENTALESVELPLAASAFGTDHANLYALRVVGDSMTGAGILDGDYAVIRKQSTINHGAIAAVLIDGEGTLKQVHRSGRRVELRAANPRYKPIVLSKENENILFGKMVGLVRYTDTSSKGSPFIHRQTNKGFER